MRGPHSLVGRMTWLVAAVSVLSLLLHLGVVSLWVDSMSEELTAGLGGRVVLTRELLQTVPAEQRDAQARALSRDRLSVHRARHPLAAAELPPPPMLPGRILERFRATVGPEVRVELMPPSGPAPRGQVMFGFELDDGPWLITYETAPPVQALLGTGLGWLALLTLAVFGSLALGVKMIARPMSKVAAELGGQAGALRRLAVPSGAGSELAALIQAFNGLVEKVGRAESTKQHLLAGVSHDLRTPLARLRLRIEIQCEGAVAEALTADLRSVERIVSQFLAYVQGDSRHPPMGEPESVRAVLSQTAASYREQGHEVSLLPGSDDIELPDLALQRLLSNLIDNAVVHGRGPVELALQADADGWALVVWDHGPGLTDAQFEQALQPFVRQVHSGDASPDLGHCGLGLAIAAQIAEQIGARLSARHDTGPAGREGGRFGVALSASRSGHHRQL